MSNLIKAITSDSTNDGIGPSTEINPEQLPNEIDDAIIIMVTQSLNNATDVENINVTTPSGYTLLTDLRDGEVRSWIFWKRSIGNEIIPFIISDTSSEWSTATAIVCDVDWINGGVNQVVQSTAGGDQQSPDLTTSSSGSGSAIICLHSLERRTIQGFRYPETRPQTIFISTSNTGTSEGIDNASSIGEDFIQDRNFLFEGPFWEASGGGDSIAFNIEVITLGNIIPLQVTQLIVEPVSTELTTQLNADWIRPITESGILLDGNPSDTWNFDASSDVDILTDQITITNHGITESVVVYLTDGGNSTPTGLSNNTYYYVRPVSTNDIQLVLVDEETDTGTDWYINGSNFKSQVDISATGSGIMTLTEARLINAPNGTSFFDIERPPNGNAGNPTAFSGGWIGDCGYNQNWYVVGSNFTNPHNGIGEVYQISLTGNNNNFRYREILFLAIDSDGDWITFKLYDLDAQGTIVYNDIVYQIEPASTLVQQFAYGSSGTFNGSSIQSIGLVFRGSNANVSQPTNNACLDSTLQVGGTFSFINGTIDTNLEDIVDLAAGYTNSISQPSDLQFVFNISLQFGDGINDFTLIDSEKSLAFPPSANGIDTFTNYVSSLGVTINATGNSNFTLKNCQLGASSPFGLIFNVDPTSTVNFDGNTYVFANANLNNSIIYNRQSFIGGEGIIDNGAEIRNSSFFINEQLGTDNGMINWNSSTNIENCSFELSSSVVAGHAIIITSIGSYTFNTLTFIGFGADESVTAAVYNNSGGIVEIIPAEGTITPTIRNGLGATTNIGIPPTTIIFN